MFLGGCSFQTAMAGSGRLGMWVDVVLPVQRGWSGEMSSLQPVTFPGGGHRVLDRPEHWLILLLHDLGRQERREGAREERTQEEARGQGEMRENRGGPETKGQLCANWWFKPITSFLFVSVFPSVTMTWFFNYMEVLGEPNEVIYDNQ